MESACYWLKSEAKDRFIRKLSGCKFAEESLEMFLATWTDKFQELDRHRMPMGSSGMRFIDATASVPASDSVPCRRRSGEVIDTSPDKLVTMRSVVKQVDDYESIWMYLRPPNWHFRGDMSLSTLAEYANWVYRNLAIEKYRQSIFPGILVLSIDLMAKWMWNIERCRQLISVWLTGATGDVPRLCILCHCGTLAVGYCPRPTVNRNIDFRFGPNSSTFSLMAIMTKLRLIVRSADNMPFATLGLCDQLLPPPIEALNSPICRLIEHSLFTAQVIASPNGQHADQILLPQLQAFHKLLRGIACIQCRCLAW